MNMYKSMQKLQSNFGYSHKFLPSHHRILAEQKKLVPHITKETFATERIYIYKQYRRKVTVYISNKDLIQYTSSILDNPEKQKLHLKTVMTISGFCSQATKEGSKRNFIVMLSIVATLVPSTMSMFFLCMKGQILIVTWLQFSQTFLRPLREFRMRNFRLLGIRLKYFQRVTTFFLMIASPSRFSSHLPKF